jgi:hypothetical protein
MVSLGSSTWAGRENPVAADEDDNSQARVCSMDQRLLRSAAFSQMCVLVGFNTETWMPRLTDRESFSTTKAPPSVPFPS